VRRARRKQKEKIPKNLPVPDSVLKPVPDSMTGTSPGFRTTRTPTPPVPDSVLLSREAIHLGLKSLNPNRRRTRSSR
jgi:hypothetical protein